MRYEAAESRSLLEFLETLFPDSSRTTLRQMLRDGRVRINSEVEKDARRPITNGDVVDVATRAERQLILPELSILYEDEDLIVVTKDVGLLTVATPGERVRTAQAFLNAYLRSRDRDRIHVVHRLDRDTSGVLVFAKNFRTREELKEQFAQHETARLYIAIVEGTMSPPNGTIRSYLREDRDLTVRTVASSAAGKLAITYYRTVESGSRYSRLEVTLETGRRNQIRVHLSEAGHPVVGDKRYGAASDPLGRLGLHARVLGFVHPGTGRQITFEAPVPDSFRKLRL